MLVSYSSDIVNIKYTCSTSTRPGSISVGISSYQLCYESARTTHKDFRNGHSDFETFVDGLDEDDKSLPGSHHTVNVKSQDLD